MAQAARRHLPWLFNATSWVASTFPTFWSGIMAAAGAVILVLFSAGAKVFADLQFIGAVLLFVMSLWTYIGLTWLITRKPADIKSLRYGLTFEGVAANFTPGNPDAALAFALMLRNFTQSPIRYFIEEFDVQIETRTLPKYQKDSLQSILARGAGRTSAGVPFKFDHIREFLGRRVEGLSIMQSDTEMQIGSLSEG